MATKLIIQIPCYNEAESLPLTLSRLPRELKGVDKVEWLVIDDGSTDSTGKVALQHGVDHVVRHKGNFGLARAFETGLEASLRLGADIIVNTDADNQYRAEDIPALIAPILAGEADMVVGERPIADLKHFSRSKKILQRLGSWVVRRMSGTDVQDAPSGFRAMSREVANRLNVLGYYTYTLETIIQAGHSSMVVKSVPIRTNAPMRPSRLFSRPAIYIWKSLVTMIRIFIIYRPFKGFALPGLVLAGLGGILFLRYAYFLVLGAGKGHVQSVIVGSLLLGAGGALFIVSLVVDLISANRKLLEKMNLKITSLEREVACLRRDGAEKPDPPSPWPEGPFPG